MSASPVLANVDTLESALVAKGFPAMSQWWRRQVERFYRSGRRQAVLRVGRRGGKSSTLARVAVLEALYGDHVIPPGDVGIVGVVSVSLNEAKERLRTIKAILDALRVRYRERGESLELIGKPVAFRVFPASVRGVVGGTWICAICDEVARWRDADTGANPATEVLGSLRPCLATMPHAKLFLSSSPLGTEDAHAKAFDLGETSHQLVAHAPTWEANPTLTEAQLRAEEPDDRMFRREYEALPQDAVSAAFDGAAVARAFVPRDVSKYERGRRVCVIDPSSGRRDSFTAGIFGWNRHSALMSRWIRKGMGENGDEWLRYQDGTPMLNPLYREPEDAHHFFACDEIWVAEGDFWTQRSADDVWSAIAALCRRHRVSTVYSDQREAFANRSHAHRHGLGFREATWTGASKPPAVEEVRRWLREGLLCLPAEERFKKELLSYEEKILPSGAITHGARGTGHDDFVALLVTAAITMLSPEPSALKDMAPAQRVAPLAHHGRFVSGLLGGYG